MNDRASFEIGGESIPPATCRDIRLKVSESYTGDAVTIPMRVIRARKPGPTIFVTAAVHGNEINGTGIIREMMFSDPLELISGTLLLIPVVNIFGFEHQDRYMPDRRDLNRSFPGRETGSLTSRVAHIFFQEIVKRCDFGLDLHAATLQRMNLPNIRGELSIPGVSRLAEAFGCELIVNSRGPMGSLRREACRAGCPTIILEAGEPSKIEPTVLKIGCRGVRNVLIELGMIAGNRRLPVFQTRVERTCWLRAQVGGILRFHVAPGDLVERNQSVATNASVFGVDQNVLKSPVDGIVLGMTTLPTVKPGEPVCLIAIPSMSIAEVRESLQRGSKKSLHEQVRKDLATSILVAEPQED